MQSASRIRKELREVSEGKSDGIEAHLLSTDNLTHWRGSILGPDDTPYAGGKFLIDIIIPPQYPFEPPKMKFITKIWHPNVSSVTGAICLDILKNEWSPALTIRTALLSVQALLSAAEPNDPQDAQVATQFKDNYPLFCETARKWTILYANAEEPFVEKITPLMEMGFDRELVKKALVLFEGDENQALDYLFANAN